MNCKLLKNKEMNKREEKEQREKEKTQSRRDNIIITRQQTQTCVVGISDYFAAFAMTKKRLINRDNNHRIHLIK
jgi:hypothetical protein